MRISVTRLKCFINNPERYRLEYVLNLAPVGNQYGLQRGTVLHTVMNSKIRGLSDPFIADVLMGKEADYDGRVIEGIEEKALLNGTELGYALWDRLISRDFKASEVSFDMPLFEDSPHGMRGKVDAISFNDDTGTLCVDEWKTASVKQKRDGAYGMVKKWDNDLQADFEILGARFAGYPVTHLEAHYIIDSPTGAQFWEPIIVKRSDAQLERTKLYVHQWCETIEMYTQNFGADLPWPHLPNWPCDGGDWCEFRHICQRTADQLTPECLGPTWGTRKPSPFEILEVK